MSAQPTSVVPKAARFVKVMIPAATTLTGLDTATFNAQPAVQAAFISGVAASLPGIRTVDVTITSVSASTRRVLSEKGGGGGGGGGGGPESQMKASDTNSGSHQVQLAAAGTVVNYNIAAIPSRLGFTDTTSAFNSLSASLQTASSSGTLVTALKAASPTYTSVSSSTVSISPAVVVTVSNPTATPTYAPTIAIVVPVIKKLLAVSTSTSFLLTVTLEKLRIIFNDVTSGSLYCVASISAPTSVGSVKAATIQNAQKDYVNATFPVSLSLMINGLVSSLSYGVYCYVETSLGYGSTLDQVVTTSIVQQTSCCKSIIFSTNTSNVNPTAVFGYISAATTSVPELFVYQVQSPPNKILVITPVVTAAPGTLASLAAQVTTVPQSITFASSAVTAAQLQGKFFLSAATPDVGGNFIITLVLSGTSATEYSSNGLQAPVKVLSASSPVPAPVLLTSTFSGSGQSVTINFDSNTDLAGIGAATWPCNRLFSFLSDSLTTCSWYSHSMVLSRTSLPFTLINLPPSIKSYYSTTFLYTLSPMHPLHTLSLMHSVHLRLTFVRQVQLVVRERHVQRRGESLQHRHRLPQRGRPRQASRRAARTRVFIGQPQLSIHVTQSIGGVGQNCCAVATYVTYSGCDRTASVVSLCESNTGRYGVLWKWWSLVHCRLVTNQLPFLCVI